MQAASGRLVEAKCHLNAVQLHLAAPRQPRFSTLLAALFCLSIETEARANLATAYELTVLCLACGYLTTGDKDLLCIAAQQHPAWLADVAAIAYPGLLAPRSDL